MPSVVVDVGKTILVNALRFAGSTGNSGAGATEPKFIAWGTGAGSSGVTNTTLFTESAEARVSGTTSSQTTTKTGDTYQVVGTLTANAARTITNAGLFDAATGGNLFAKFDFTGIPLESGDSVSFTFKIVLSD
jgi:hypothetical protein